MLTNIEQKQRQSNQRVEGWEEKSPMHLCASVVSEVVVVGIDGWQRQREREREKKTSALNRETLTGSPSPAPLASDSCHKCFARVERNNLVGWTQYWKKNKQTLQIAAQTEIAIPPTICFIFVRMDLIPSPIKRIICFRLHKCHLGLCERKRCH